MEVLLRAADGRRTFVWNHFLFKPQKQQHTVTAVTAPEICKLILINFLCLWWLMMMFFHIWLLNFVFPADIKPHFKPLKGSDSPTEPAAGSPVRIQAFLCAKTGFGAGPPTAHSTGCDSARCTVQPLAAYCVKREQNNPFLLNDWRQLPPNVILLSTNQGVICSDKDRMEI